LEANRSGLDSARASSAAKDMLKQLARTDPYYKRNRPHVCSFFVKGECNRGTQCPFRHEKPTEGALAKQNIQDRYHGRSDPVAQKIMTRHATDQGLKPPEDTSIMSLFLSSLPADVTEQSLRTIVVKSLPSMNPDKLKSVVHVAKSKCAFVNFKDRDSAERAAEAWANGIDIGGERANVKWGRGRNSTPKPTATPVPIASTSA